MVTQLQVPGAAYRVAAINVPKYNATMTELAQESPFFGPLTHQKLMVPSMMIFRFAFSCDYVCVCVLVLFHDSLPIIGSEGYGRPYHVDWENPQKFVDYLQRFAVTAHIPLETDNDEIEFNRMLSTARIVVHLDKNDPHHDER